MTLIIDRTTIDSKVSSEFLKAPFVLYKGYNDVINRFNTNSDTHPTRSDEYPTFFEKHKSVLMDLEERGKIEGSRKSRYVDEMVNEYITPVLEGINKIAAISDEDRESLRYKANLDAHIAYSIGVKEHKPQKSGIMKSPVTWFGAIVVFGLSYMTLLYQYAKEDMQKMYDENFAKVQLEIETAKEEIRLEIEQGKEDVSKIIDEGLVVGDKILEKRINEGIKKAEDATSFNPFKKK